MATLAPERPELNYISTLELFQVSPVNYIKLMGGFDSFWWCSVMASCFLARENLLHRYTIAYRYISFGF